MEEIEDETGHLDVFVDEEFDCSEDPPEDNFCKYGGFAIYCLFCLIELPISPRIPAEKVVFYIHLSSHLSL